MNDKVVFFLTTDDFYWIRTQGLVGYEPSALTTKPRLLAFLKNNVGAEVLCCEQVSSCSSRTLRACYVFDNLRTNLKCLQIKCSQKQQISNLGNTLNYVCLRCWI